MRYHHLQAMHRSVWEFMFGVVLLFLTGAIIGFSLGVYTIIKMAGM